ncbi:MAG TPA: hypothetical protein VL614_03065 [Acetobacteraceae bacterium]|jgi:hypothetical protein|nr:hypothetical protein [Acetobacteraceae bacterium]
MSKLLRALRSIGRTVLIAGAVFYFLIDLLFLSLIRRVRRQIGTWRWMQATRRRIETLAPYTSLLVLIIPWIILEPIKPVGLVVIHHRHIFAGTAIVIIGELLKLAIFDQLFEMTKPRLLTLPWFARCYATWRDIVDRLKAIPVWQTIKQWGRAIRLQVRQQLLGQRARSPTE